MGQVYQCWWRICREINVFSRFEYHKFYVLYPFTDSPLYFDQATNPSFQNLSHPLLINHFTVLYYII
jgi:hypothetical protein